ncbi:MAG: hypothetical protein IOB81_24740, partial [Burkholderia sp.]|nr:hypothetical protein [Burkholderia sp.]
MLNSQPAPSSANALPDYLQCSHDVVCGLIDTVSAALFAHFPKAAGDTLDAELVLDALRVFRPAVAEIGMLDGVRSLVGSGHLERAADAIAAAIAILERFPQSRGRSLPSARLLFALSLRDLGDRAGADAQIDQERQA